MKKIIVALIFITVLTALITNSNSSAFNQSDYESDIDSYSTDIQKKIMLI